ncbi:Hypothetical predicted protein [Cloeon dipterum]|uniref:Uncharacterized protein n=1 Tax=Cloeon dipterum TaxID=197152 RepID=A0A8S1DVG6_9INSE|nr:Hypothetical predicted protein [Cloeon dipterum]
MIRNISECEVQQLSSHPQESSKKKLGMSLLRPPVDITSTPKKGEVADDSTELVEKIMDNEGNKPLNSTTPHNRHVKELNER